MALLKLSLAAALSCTAAATYPTAYPFENESLDVSGPLSATPSRTMDEEDPGGYVFHYVYLLTDFPLDEPWSFGGSTGYIDYRLHVLQGVPKGDTPMIPIGIFNCTSRMVSKGFDFANKDTWIGEIAGNVICTECCKDQWGIFVFWSDEPEQGLYDQQEDIFDQGMCEDMYDENTLCSMFNAGLPQCIENFVSHTERLHVGGCYDLYYNYLMGCKVYQLEGVPRKDKWEPEEYFDASSAEEMNAWRSLWETPDRVCHPYSYFHPETAKAVDAKDVDAETIESVCGECGNSCSDGLPANCDDLAKLLENGSDLATLTAKGECAASCSDECVALITDAFGSCKSISSTSSKSSTSGAALNGAIAVAAVAVLLL